jgi:hypothetical protein
LQAISDQLRQVQAAAGDAVSAWRRKGEKMSPGPRTFVGIGCLIRTTARRFGWNDRFVALPRNRAKPARRAIETGKVAKVAEDRHENGKAARVALTRSGDLGGLGVLQGKSTGFRGGTNSANIVSWRPWPWCSERMKTGKVDEISIPKRPKRGYSFTLVEPTTNPKLVLEGRSSQTRERIEMTQ